MKCKNFYMLILLISIFSASSYAEVEFPWSFEVGLGGGGGNLKQNSEGDGSYVEWSNGAGVAFRFNLGYQLTESQRLNLGYNQFEVTTEGLANQSVDVELGYLYAGYDLVHWISQRWSIFLGGHVGSLSYRLDEEYTDAIGRESKTKDFFGPKSIKSYSEFGLGYQLGFRFTYDRLIISLTAMNIFGLGKGIHSSDKNIYLRMRDLNTFFVGFAFAW